MTCALTRPERWPRVVPAAVVGLLAALLYLPALSNDFVNWDDDRLVVDNPAVTRGDGLGRIWSTVELPASFPNYPLTFTTYWLEHRLWGLNPRGYHAVNVLLHGVNAALVVLLLYALGCGAWVATLAGALFAVHPMQVESVAWVAERKNVLSTAAFLAALLAYLRHRVSGRPAWYAAALVLFAAALLAKTATVVLPFTLLLSDRWRDGGWTRASLLRALPFFAFSLAAGVMTLLVESPTVSTPLALRPLLAASVLSFYAGKLLVPVALQPVYPRWELSLSELRWWAPLLGLGAAAFLVWRWQPPWRVRWGLGHFVCALLPVLGLVPFGYSEYSFVADRHVYLASIGAALLAALALDALRPRAAVALGAAVLVAGLALLTARQIGVWRNSVVLWSTALAYQPDLWVAQNNLALALIERGRLDEAAGLLEDALAARPRYAEAHANLALVRYRQGDLATAERHCRQAYALKPYEPHYAKNLAIVLAERGDLAGATAVLRGALGLAPDAEDLRGMLADMLRKQGQGDTVQPSEHGSSQPVWIR